MTFNFLAARPWLLLASFALGISALLAILLVLSRAPHVQELFGLQSLFHTILVLHVNFAVLVWLLSFIGFIWVGCTQNIHRYFHGLVFVLCVVGAFLMLSSPLIGDAKPIMSNYVPVMDSTVFFVGLCVFALGISMLAWAVIREHPWGVIKASALMWFVALCVFVYHFIGLEKSGSTIFFEHLFWGGGHVLQFIYILVLWLVWRWPNTEPLKGQLVIAVIIMLLALSFMFFLDPSGFNSRKAYTLLMQVGMLALLLPMLWWWYRGGDSIKSLRLSLFSSALLILLGVIIGLLIRDDSVIVTAHYHATNAAITVAFMGLSYFFVEKFSTKNLTLGWIKFQIMLYTSGMILYVLGMAGSGWLGVPRKTAMILEDNSLERISMGVMGLGGALSIIATLVFVGFMFYAFLQKNKIEESK
ncbi:MAG: cbb3-type cytochrome c oxidase subunit I [Thiomicrorhabdus sp.]|nr:cbb3-type cytochrome c oxidase subunit I [Thiomicrorhabdus sp.]